MKTRILFSLLALTVGGLRAQVLIPGPVDTSSFWNRSTALQFGGLIGYQTVGQVFTAPAGATSLDEFLFAGASYPRDSILQSRAMVMSWNVAEAHPTGSVLFARDWHSLGGYRAAIFDTGGLSVAAGGTYVAFLTTFPFMYSDSSGTIAAILTDVYAGGGLGPGSKADPDTLEDSLWLSGKADLYFRAEFSNLVVPQTEPEATPGAVPEPAAEREVRRALRTPSSRPEHQCDRRRYSEEERTAHQA